MVQINFAMKEVNCKIVFYGPGMSGKTTNLEVVHEKAPPKNKGDLTSIATEGDRTLFFDFMPLDLGTIAGMRTKLQLYTVPGQVYYNSTRKLVLQGVDGIIFVADSQASKIEENLESLENLKNNLEEYGKKAEEIAMVIQYNKRDLPDILPVEELERRLNPRGVPSFEAVASTGEGVFPTLKALSAMVLESLSRSNRTGISRSARRERPTSTAAQTERRGAAPVPAAAAVAAGQPAREAPRPAAKPSASTPPARTSPARTPPPRTSPARTPPARETPRRFGGGDTGARRPERPIERMGRLKSQTPRQEPQTPWGQPAPEPRQTGYGLPGSNPNVRSFVLDKERGSPLPMVLLGMIITLAAGIVLFSLGIL